MLIAMGYAAEATGQMTELCADSIDKGFAATVPRLGHPPHAAMHQVR
jgi:hypothetical protein